MDRIAVSSSHICQWGTRWPGTSIRLGLRLHSSCFAAGSWCRGVQSRARRYGMVLPYVAALRPLHSHHGERNFYEFARPITLGRDSSGCSSCYCHQRKHVCSLVSLHFGSWLLHYAVTREICSFNNWRACSASKSGFSPVVDSCHQKFCLHRSIDVAEGRPMYWRG